MDEYRLTATWRIAAPQQRVFDAICDSLTWPTWWPGSTSVVQIAPGDECGIDCKRQYIWKSHLPYRLMFLARTTRVEAPSLIEAVVSGDVEGIGRWSLSREGDMTTVHHEWHVRTTKQWMNLTAPFIRSVFIMNHHALMKRGAVGMARLLDSPLIDFQYGEVRRFPMSHSVNWVAAGIAGVVAGAVATAVQLLLWWSAQLPVFNMLLRDSRFAAAIILGQNVLPPPLTFDWKVMLVASALHFVLSIVYGFSLAPFVARASRLRDVLAGSVFGLAVFALNMYGFTALFPWFVASRDWITAVAHIAFGFSCALAFRALQNVLDNRPDHRRRIKEE